MNDLSPLDALRIVETFGTADETVLGYDCAQLQVHIFHSTKHKIEVDGHVTAAAVKSLNDSLMVVSNAELVKMLNDLIDVAEFDSDRGDIKLTSEKLDECKILRDEIVGKIKTTHVSNVAARNGTGKKSGDVGLFSNGLFITVNSTFSRLMSNHELYTVPTYQRKYCWTVDQLEDLWYDLTEIMASNEKHFLGFVMLQKVDEENIDVLDGQQRFVSVLLFLLAAMIRLRQLATNEGDPGKYDRERGILHKMLVPERINNTRLALALTLTEPDQLQLSNMVDHEEIWRGGKNKHLNDAFRFFGKMFGEIDDAQVVNEMVTKMIKSMVFIEIMVPSEMVAYTMFEALNNRGIQMAGSDMIKNLVINEVHKHLRGRKNQVSESWDVMIEALNGSNLLDFFKAVQLSQGEVGGGRNLYRKVRKMLPDQISGEDFVKSLETVLPDYQMLTDKQATALSHDGLGRASAAENIRILNIFDATSHLGLAMAALSRLRPRDFVRLIKTLLDLEIRHNFICKLPRKALERQYAAVTRSIIAGNVSWNQIRKSLGKACPTDADFKTAFSHFSFAPKGSTKQATYILRSLENQASNEIMRPPPAANLTIEHVLPQSIDSWWEEHFEAKDPEQYVYRIGNLALLGAQTNSKLGQAPVAEKFAELRNTDLVINNRLASGDSWNYDALVEHQRYLADLAVFAWPMPWVTDSEAGERNQPVETEGG